jgi:hypothetical protein
MEHLSKEESFHQIADMEKVGGVCAEILPGLQVIEISDGDFYSVRLDIPEARALRDWLNKALP